MSERVTPEADLSAEMSALVASAEDAIVTKSLDGTIRSWNAAAERLLGYAAAEIVGQSVNRIIPDERLDEEADVLRRIGAGERVVHLETERRRKDGSVVEVSLTLSPIRDAHGTITGASKIMRDISERRRAEAARDRSHVELGALSARLHEEVAARTSELEAARRHLRAILDALPSMVGYWDADLVNRFANKAYEDWFGVTPSTMLGTRLPELLGPELFARNRAHVEAALRGEVQSFERQIPRPDGGGMRHSLAHYLPDVVGLEVRGFHVLVHDVTELVSARQKLAESLGEREIMLQELHHRVKNNLQVISSLLSLEMHRLAPESDGREAIAECRRRVRAIALVHERLYHAQDHANVRFGEHLRELVTSELRARAPKSQIALEFEVEDVSVPVNFAIPCTLIASELVTNALKHAFVGRDRGRLRVAFEQRGRAIVLEVSDDGVGLPAGFALDQAGSMGMRLIVALSRQIRGNVALGGAAATGTVARLEIVAPTETPTSSDGSEGAGP